MTDIKTEAEYDEFLGPVLKQIDPKCLITPKQAEERGIPMGAAGYIWVDDIKPGTIIGDDIADARKALEDYRAYTVQQAKKDFDEVCEEAAAENAKRIANVCA